MNKPRPTQEQVASATGGRKTRGRSKKLDAAITTATLRLLASHGPASVSIDAVARDVGCARSSIYRRFPTKESLITEAARTHFGSPPSPEGGSLLDRIAINRAASFGEPASVLAITLLMGEAVRGTEMGRRYLDEVIGPIRLQRTELLTKAISNGEIQADTDIGLLQDIIVGALLFRIAHHPEPEEDLARRITAILSDGVRPRPG
jgi:AcrR family transcriptional regulator